MAIYLVYHSVGLTNLLGFAYPKPKMIKNFKIPPSFSFVKKGRVSLLLRDDYKDLLLKMGIEDVGALIKNHFSSSYYLEGRTPHPSIPIEGGKRMVIRRYLHGGLLRRLTGDLYLMGSRSFDELAITEEIRSCGISTIHPIGAIHHAVFHFFYRACLLSLEVPHAENLTQYFQKKGSNPSGESLLNKRRTIRAAGTLLGKFHQKGFCHRDLQLKNLLVAGDRVLIIDFDRSCRKKALSLKARVSNLLRLNRSVDKWKRSGLPITRTDRLRFLLAYAGGDRKIVKAIKKSLRTYSVGLLFHRIGWAIGNIVRVRG
jgi:tRNA A-37 threonylcarbamoyl transferase component Bud32